MAAANQELAAVFQEMAELLLICGAAGREIDHNRQVAYLLASQAEPLQQLLQSPAVAQRLGADTLRQLTQVLHCGGCDELWRLRRQLPQGLRELLLLPGLSPHVVRRLFLELGVSSVDHLEIAARAGRLTVLPCVTPEQVSALLHDIEVLRRHRRPIPLAEAQALVQPIIDALRSVPGTWQVVVAGDYRRRRALIGDLSLVVCADEPAPHLDLLRHLPDRAEVVSEARDRISVRLTSLRRIDLVVTRPEWWGAALHLATGSALHRRLLRLRGQQLRLTVAERGIMRAGQAQVSSCPTEVALYNAFGLPYIPPELREGADELAAAAENRLPRLVRADDLRGDLHLHTTASDGSGSALEMLQAAIPFGYEYLAITDHSISLAVANGLDGARLRQQRHELRRLEQQAGTMHLLAGVEVDIMADGSLDLEPAVLEQLDWVVASVHSHLDMPAAQMTRRLVRAMESGLVDCIGHLHGRRLGQREPYQLELEQVLQAARRTGVAIEVNGHPRRMDADEQTCRQAVGLGVPLVISTDAHAPMQLRRRDLALAMARRGWVEAGQVLNTRPLAALQDWRQDRRRRHGIVIGSSATKTGDDR